MATVLSSFIKMLMRKMKRKVSPETAVLLGDDDDTLHRTEQACAPWRRRGGACSVLAPALKEPPLSSRTTAAGARICSRRPTASDTSSAISPQGSSRSTPSTLSALLPASTSVPRRWDYIEERGCARDYLPCLQQNQHNLPGILCHFSPRGFLPQITQSNQCPPSTQLVTCLHRK
jgi:hypothetical protein